MPMASPVSIADVHDGLGEIANMIAGNLKPLLPPGVTLSMPSVIAGADHSRHFPDVQYCLSLPCADSSRSFRIGFVQFREKSRGRHHRE